ncbi:MAG TPA: MarR family transcriptional regulator [Burkholderiales bacterium]|nr:MarR family transcriptional regulator [Burkholderiales bacterium]
MTTPADLDISSHLLDALPPVIRAIRAAMIRHDGARFTVPQFRVLGFVSLQPCTSKQLAEWQGVSLPAMSRMVAYLIRRRLLTRTPDANDRRQAQLRLSAKGRQEFERLRKTIETSLAERIATLHDGQKRPLMTSLIVLGELFGEQ